MEPRKILVAVAWPYAQGSMHLGHLAGAYLPPDIFARYHRARGNDVLMVSGSDVHGTPITVKADEEGVPIEPRDGNSPFSSHSSFASPAFRPGWSLSSDPENTCGSRLRENHANTKLY